MKILGISAHYHDSAAALVVDGVPVASLQEERLSRRKNDAAFPLGAIEHCLDVAGLEPEALDAVVFYEKPIPTKGLRPADVPDLMQQVHSVISRRVDDYWRERGKI